MTHRLRPLAVALLLTTTACGTSATGPQDQAAAGSRPTVTDLGACTDSSGDSDVVDLVGVVVQQAGDLTVTEFRLARPCRRPARAPSC